MEESKFVSTTLLPIALFLIMTGIGMSSSFKNFKLLFTYPKAFLVGLINQNILLPLLGAWLISQLPLSYPIQLGLFLIILCPSGTASNIITKMIGGNLELSVLLTTISNFTAILLIPIYLQLFGNYIDHTETELNLPIFSLLNSIFWSTVFPVSIGLILRHYFPKSIDRGKVFLKWFIPGTLFLIFFLILVFDGGDPQPNEWLDNLGIAAALNLGLLSMVGLIVRTFKLTPKNQLAVIIEGGLKNSAIGLYISASLLESPETSTVLIAYGLVSFYLSLAFGWIWSRSTEAP